MPSGGLSSSLHPYRHLATTLTTTTSSSMTSLGLSLDSSAGHQLLSRTNLYIRGLKPETTDKDLVTLCQQSVFHSLTHSLLSVSYTGLVNNNAFVERHNAVAPEAHSLLKCTSSELN